MGTTVKECISQYIHRYGNKLKRVWLCPQIVKNPKVGVDYVLEVAINSRLSEILLESRVTKCWKENDCLCIAYKISDEILAQSVDKLLERNNLSIEEVIE